MKLFPRIIQSIEFDEESLIIDILNLHNFGNSIDLDPCYSIGRFYNGLIQRPSLIFDINPQVSYCPKGDCRDLSTIDDGMINCIMFDPPFLITGSDKEDSKGVMYNRFSGFNTFKDLRDMYRDSLIEFYRILRKGGIVIFKCQDVNSGRVQHFTHCLVHDLGIASGFYPKDLFILLSKNRMIGKHKRQDHARKFHCYYWVLKKSNAGSIPRKIFHQTFNS